MKYSKKINWKKRYVNLKKRYKKIQEKSSENHKYKLRYLDVCAAIRD